MVILYSLTVVFLPVISIASWATNKLPSSFIVIALLPHVPVKVVDIFVDLFQILTGWFWPETYTFPDESTLIEFGKWNSESSKRTLAVELSVVVFQTLVP